MIRTLLLTAAILTSIQLDAKKIAGYFIANNGDTIQVSYKINIIPLTQLPDFERMQKKVVYYLGDRKRKYKLRPNMAKEIVFEWNGATTRLLSRRDDLSADASLIRSNERLFLHLIQDGKVQLFKRYTTPNGIGAYGIGGGVAVGGYTTIENYVLQKNEGKLFQTRLFSFKKDMAGFFTDCPRLAEKIKGETYLESDVEAIVMEYNQNCQ